MSSVEAYLQIQQLAQRYTFAIDSRDLDAVVALYVPDISRPDMAGAGRAQLKELLDERMRLRPASWTKPAGASPARIIAGEPDNEGAEPLILRRTPTSDPTGWPSPEMRLVKSPRGIRIGTCTRLVLETQ